MTIPPVPDVPNDGADSHFGRDLRMVVGAIIFLGNLVLIAVAATRKPPEPVTTHDLWLHGMAFVAGAFLMQPTRLVALLGAVKDKIPVIGNK